MVLAFHPSSLWASQTYITRVSRQPGLYRQTCLENKQSQNKSRQLGMMAQSFNSSPAEAMAAAGPLQV